MDLQFLCLATHFHDEGKQILHCCKNLYGKKRGKRELVTPYTTRCLNANNYYTHRHTAKQERNGNTCVIKYRQRAHARTYTHQISSARLAKKLSQQLQQRGVQEWMVA